MIYRDYTATERCVECGKWRDHENPNDCTCMVFSAPSRHAEKRIPYYIGDNGVAGMLKPILFSAPMIRAILAGNKTQTRRVAELKYGEIPDICFMDGRKHEFVRDEIYNDGTWCCHKCAICSGLKARYDVGDTLWVRETWARGIGKYLYRADVECEHDYRVATWKPSIHMPLSAARIFLRVTGVRVERLCSITEADAEKEGCPKTFNPANGKLVARAREEFQDVWNKINAKRGFGWMTNPWVWVYSFNIERIIKQNELQ